MKKSIIALLLVLFCFSIAQNIKAAPADIVVFTDNNLKREVNRSLGVSDLEADITEAQIATLSSLKIIVDNVTSISSLEGLQFATNLRTLKLGTEFEGEGVALTTNDITPLGDLTKLDTIALFGQTSFTNFNELKLLNDNAYLDISVNVTGFNSLAGIETMNNIQYLSLLSSDAAGTNLDMSNIENITAIYDLYLDGINITNAATADFSKLVNMSSIAIKNSNITNLNFLKAGMSILNISFNNNKSLTDVSALTNFPDIKSVNLPSNNISDISFLSSFTKLSSISLKGNNISDISVLGTLDLSVINMIIQSY